MKYILFCTILVAHVISCKKGQFLQDKPDQKLIIPNKLEDFQSLLDNHLIMNGTMVYGVIPSFGEEAADDYYFLENFNSFPGNHKNLYIWNDDIYSNNLFSDWNYAYRSIFYANVALDEVIKLRNISEQRLDEYNNIVGSALFYRAHMFYQLAQVFGQPYDKKSSNEDVGIPLRKSGDVNEKLRRASVQETYDQILSDLNTAKQLLPTFPLYLTRPSKVATCGLLARVYLTMMKYDSAFKYASECISLKGDLLDYNEITGNASDRLIPSFNKEVLFHALLTREAHILQGIGLVDTVLVSLYKNDDLRKILFFQDLGDNKFSFRGSYSQSSDRYAGITTDEIYLIGAESSARIGEYTQAVNLLNALMVKRWVKGKFVPFTASDKDEIVNIILNERRKELLFRGLRWTDLRRLNKEGANITLTRKVDNNFYYLPPNDLRYTFLIPPDIMGFNPLFPQTPR